MEKHSQFYINGQWVKPVEARLKDVVNPSTEQSFTQISFGDARDVDMAVMAAKRAFQTFSRTSVEERIALLNRILAEYKNRFDDIALAISKEMGAPLWLSKAAQVPMGIAHLKQTIKVLQNFEFIAHQGSTAIFHEPIGVVGMITPWNWPINQIMCKVAPALAAGCTMVLKPSELAPISAILLAEVLDAAGVPPGVFNLVNGDGADVGQPLASHPDIDMVTFTGSTGAGINVAHAAAPTVKRVAQELGGKSANILLPDVDFSSAVKQGVHACFTNSGQSCNAPTRMLVPRGNHDEAIAIARATAQRIEVADALSEGSRHLGPVVSERQFQKVQQLIQAGIDEGATLVAGGLGRPEHLTEGYFVKPTIFAGVSRDMRIAQEEIFGPVLAILPYDSKEEAIEIANSLPYGLAAYVQAGSLDQARELARELRAGMVHLNGAGPDISAPFGGYKQSGNGREWGVHGFREFLEVKAVMGFSPAD